MNNFSYKGYGSYINMTFGEFGDHTRAMKTIGSGGSRIRSVGVPSLKTFPVGFVDLTLSQEYMMCFTSLNFFTTKINQFSIF